MFGKISKLALGMNLIGGMMSWNCNAAETVQVPDELTMMIKSFADSLEFKKPTRVFITIIAALDKIIPELDNLSQIPSTNQRFFLALHKIFSNQNLEVNDDSVAAILESADKGCKGAQEMVIAAFGKGTGDKIGDKRTLLKKQMQDVLSESSSDSDDSGADFGVKDMSEEEKGRGLINDAEEESSPESGNSPLEQLQDDISVGITSYIKNPEDQSARFVITSTLLLMLSFPKDQYSDDQVMEDIDPLKFLDETRPLYEDLVKQLSRRS